MSKLDEINYTSKFSIACLFLLKRTTVNSWHIFRTIPERVDRMVKHGIHTEDYYLEKCLGDYIYHHNKIFDMIDNIEVLFNFLFLLIILGSMSLLCFLLYQSSRVS